MNYRGLKDLAQKLLKSNVVRSETKGRIEDYFRRNGHDISPSYQIHKDYAHNICQLRSILLNEYFNNSKCPRKAEIKAHIDDQWTHRKQDLVTITKDLKREKYAREKKIQDLERSIEEVKKEKANYQRDIITIDVSISKVDDLLKRFSMNSKRYSGYDLEYLDSARMTTSLKNRLIVKDIREELSEK